MTYKKIEFLTPFAEQTGANHLTITILNETNYEAWAEKQTGAIKTQFAEADFTAKPGQVFALRDDHGKTESLVAGTNEEIEHLDGAKIYASLCDSFSEKHLETTSFEFSAGDLSEDELNRLYIGAGWAAYRFDRYKQDTPEKTLNIVLSDKADQSRITAFVQGVCLIRDLVNTPANDMGPDELQDAVNDITAHHDVKMNVIKDNELLDQNFPMIFEVGKGSSRRPRLLDFTWGDESHPKVTLVGKGVCFDTGGYDIKPSQFMLTMKKDMGGSAHVLGLAHMIMSLNLPIRLRVLIPAVENSISGDAYRPSDVLQTRKGITVEVGNTDAEGRLVLADTLTYACEEKPELLIDFATLTGAARIALGFELPALFSNTDKTAQELQALSAQPETNDPIWQLPLWQPYRRHLESNCADISSTGGKAGATTAALFLQEFVEETIEWVHMDVYSWSESETPGRPKGGADTGMRALFALLEERYGRA